MKGPVKEKATIWLNIKRSQIKAKRNKGASVASHTMLGLLTTVVLFLRLRRTSL